MDARDELGRLNDELADLKQARDQAFENKKAADEALKRQEEKEAREGAREGAAAGGVPLEALEEMKTKFGSQVEPSSWDFEFVKTKPFDEVCKVVRDVVSVFTRGPTTATPFEYPVVDGASGSGKSRTCVEVGKALEAEGNAVSLFVNCDEVLLMRPGEERNVLASKAQLARVIFDALASPEEHCRFHFTLDEVLLKFKNDTGKHIIVLQLDEYSANQELVRVMIRACDAVFRRNRDKGTGVVVVPVLSGIPFMHIRNILVKVSKKAEPQFVTLTNVEDVDGLKASFCKQAVIKGEPANSNLDIIFNTFGGVPRLYQFLLEVLQKDASETFLVLQQQHSLGAGDAKKLYSTVMQKHKAKYGLDVWGYIFRVKAGDATFKRLSDPSRQRAKQHLRRIHTVAAIGAVIDVDRVIWPESDISLTYREASATGLFTLVIHKNHLGTIFVPLLTLDAYSEWSEVCPPDTLSPFAYTWQSMEFVALVTLRCRWNAIFFTAPGTEVSVADLRPGAYCNKKSIQRLPKVKVDKELPEIKELATKFAGDATTEFHTQRDGKGPQVMVTDRSIFLFADNEPGNDGVCRIDPFAWVNQTKSQDLLAKNESTIAQGDVANLVGHQKNSLVFDFGDDVKNIIFDLFTNRKKGTRLEDDKLPPNTFLTTSDNFADVVGPTFEHTIAIILARSKCK